VKLASYQRRAIIGFMAERKPLEPEPLIYIGDCPNAFLLMSMMSFHSDYEIPDWDTKGMANERI